MKGFRASDPNCSLVLLFALTSHLDTNSRMLEAGTVTRDEVPPDGIACITATGPYRHLIAIVEHLSCLGAELIAGSFLLM